MKKRLQGRAGMIGLMCLLLLLLTIPTLKISANPFDDPTAAAYSFYGDSVQVKQAVPFYDSGVMALYNDDSLVIYQKHPDTGELLQSKVANVTNIKAIIDENRVLTNDKKVLLINTDVDESYAYSGGVMQNLSNVMGVSGDYYLIQSTGSTYQVKYYDHETPGAAVKTVCSVAKDVYKRQDDNALVSVIVRVEDKRLERRFGVAAGRRHVFNHLLHHGADVGARLGGNERRLVGGNADDVLDFGAHPLGVGAWQINFIDDRHNLQPRVHGEIGVGERLRLYPL